MAIFYTLWTSASNILKSEPSCTSHKPRVSLQSWQVWWGLVHRKCPHAATQSYVTEVPNACVCMVSVWVWVRDGCVGVRAGLLIFSPSSRVSSLQPSRSCRADHRPATQPHHKHIYLSNISKLSLFSVFSTWRFLIFYDIMVMFLFLIHVGSVDLGKWKIKLNYHLFICGHTSRFCSTLYKHVT